MTGLPFFPDTAGIPKVSDAIKLTDVDLSDPLNPMFSLLSLSLNGPPTKVRWYRNRQEVRYDVNHTLALVVTDMYHSEYEIMLTVKGNEPGGYQCCVENSRTPRQVCSQVYYLEGKALSQNVL